MEDKLSEVLAGYLFYQAAVFELMANARENNSQLLLGISITGEWLAQGSQAVLNEMEALQQWIQQQR